MGTRLQNLEEQKLTHPTISTTNARVLPTPQATSQPTPSSSNVVSTFQSQQNPNKPPPYIAQAQPTANNVPYIAQTQPAPNNVPPYIPQPYNQQQFPNQQFFNPQPYNYSMTHNTAYTPYQYQPNPQMQQQPTSQHQQVQAFGTYSVANHPFPSTAIGCTGLTKKGSKCAITSAHSIDKAVRLPLLCGFHACYHHLPPLQKQKFLNSCTQQQQSEYRRR